MNNSKLFEMVTTMCKQNGEPHTKKETDDIQFWCWARKDCKYMNDKYDKYSHLFKSWIKNNKWKITTEQADAHFKVDREDYPVRQCSKQYITLLYNKKKDKISIQLFTTMYRINYPVTRIFFIKHNIPLLCFSKHVYGFQQYRSGRRWKYSPRIYTGWYYSELSSSFLRPYLNIMNPDVLRLRLPYKYMESYDNFMHEGNPLKSEMHINNINEKIMKVGWRNLKIYDEVISMQKEESDVFTTDNEAVDFIKEESK